MISSSPPIRDTTAFRTERGAATLLIGLTLVFASTLLAVSVAQTTTLEQRMSRNALLARQARHAAGAGLDYGKAWLKTRRPEWVAQPDGREIATATPNAPPLRSATGGEFAINLAFERRAAWGGYIRVHATATPAGAPEVEAKASQFVRPLGVLTIAGEAAPPLVIDGCADLRNTHDIYPQRADTPAAAVAVRSSMPAGCLQRAGASLHGGSVQGEAFDPEELWEQTFAVRREEFRELAAAQREAMVPALSRDYWWAQDTDLIAGEWRNTLGSPQRPVVLVIPEELGCPPFGGGAQIVGTVFIEADCGGAPAWGTVRIYGSLVVRGDFAGLGPGSRLLHISQAPGGAEHIAPPPLDLIQLAGSWRDFQ